MSTTSKGLLGLALAALAGGGCGTNPHTRHAPPPEARVVAEAPVDELPRFDEPLRVESAYYRDGTLFLRYGIDGDLRHGSVTREDRQNLSVHANWFPVFHIDALAAERWGPAVDGAFALPLGDAAMWRAFRGRVIEELAPASRGEGTLLNYRDIEYVWFRDPRGALTGVDLKSKPPGLPITGQYRIEAMTDSLFDTMERFLAERGAGHRQMLVATGETGAYARPFVVFDLDQREFAFLSLEEFTFGSMPNNYVVTGGKVGDHIVRSYLLEPLNRPFTFVSRLFFLMTDSVADLSRRVWVNRIDPAAIGPEGIAPLHDGPGMDLEEWERQLDRLVGPERYEGSIELLVDGDAFFPALISSIIDARESVKMRTYIFDGDDYAVALADLLKRRSEEVDVRILLDGLGTLMAQDAAAGTVPDDYKAPLGITSYLQRDSRIELRSLTNPWTVGDHTKTTIVDGDHAYIGGMNIGREYRWEWHDMMMRVEGPIVAYIEREFDKTWAYGAPLGDYRLAGHTLSHPRPASDSPQYPIRPLLTLPRRSEIYKAQVAAIRNARSYVYVQNAYFSDAVIIHELAEARLRGVDVRVIIPMEGNHGVMNANNVLAANKMLAFGVRVFVYPGMSHIKAAVYDGWACVGSANFDKLSFQVNKEMNLGSADPRFVDALIEHVFEPDFAASRELTAPLPAGWRNTFASILASQL